MSGRVVVTFGRRLAHSALPCVALAAATCVLLGALACAAPSNANGIPASRQISPQAGHGGTRGECFSVPSRVLQRAVPYCVVLPPSYDAEKTRRYPILYYLHGLGDNQQMLLRSGGFNLLEDLWDEKRLGEFVIATPAAGSSFYVDSRDLKNRYEDFFVQEFLPYIEHRYRVEPGRAFRGIGGISMGGYGALHLAFRHPDLFSSVSGISAALIEKPPAIALDESSEAGPLRLFGDVFGVPFDRAYWDRNNPLILARTADLASSRSISIAAPKTITDSTPARRRCTTCWRHGAWRTTFISIPAATPGTISPLIFPPPWSFIRMRSAPAR